MTTTGINWGARMPTPFGWYVDSERPHSGFSITHDCKAGRYILGKTDESAGRKNHHVVSGFDSFDAAATEADRIARGLSV